MVKLLAVLATLPLVAFAVPAPYPSVLHPETHTVALDEVNRRMIAFDREGRKLGIYSADADMPRRRGAQCFPMDNAEIKDIPGLQHLRDVANSKWGDHKRREVVNDSDFPDRPMNVCADDAGAILVYDGTPSCTEVKNEAQGTLEGGKVWLQNQVGTSMSSESTVTRSSAWGVGVKVTTGFKFPGIVDLGFEYSGTAEFTNTQGTSTTLTQDKTTLQRIEQPVDEGMTDCKLILTTKTCSITGNASLNMVATGFFWFEYEDKRAPINGDKDDKHYKWGMVIENELPDIKDRSTIVNFKTSGDIHSDGKFSSVDCTKGVSLTGGS